VSVVRPDGLRGKVAFVTGTTLVVDGGQALIGSSFIMNALGV
jgi:hypothetical protein